MHLDLRVTDLAPGVRVFSWPGPAPLPRLSPAEQAVVRLAAAGLSNDDIATARGASVRTIANQLARAYKKLGVASRSAAAAALLGDDALPPLASSPRRRP